MSDYQFFEQLMLRAPYYSFLDYAPQRLPDILLDKAFQEAILLASPQFYEALRSNDFCYDELTPKQRFTALKYYNRMCYRPVPFGSFSSFSITPWASGRLSFKRGDKLHLLRGREDMVNDQKDNNDPLLHINPMLYRLGNEFRFYCKEVTGPAGKFDYPIRAIDAETLTVRLLSKLKDKPLHAAAVLDFIIGNTGCTTSEATDLLEFLVGEQVLCIARPDQHLIREDAERFTELRPDRVYYAALERFTEGGPSAEDRQELMTGLGALQRMAAGSYMPLAPLEQFRRAFVKRFDLQKVPLMTALDPDTGISYDQQPGGTNPAWTETHRLLLHLWLQNSERGFYDEVIIKDEDLSALPDPAVNWPLTTSVLFRRSDDRLVIEHAGGPTATALTGRFSLFSKDVHAICRQIAETELQLHPELIFADVVAENGLHIDNVNRRASIYPYEIRLSGCGKKVDAVIITDDLTLSVRHDEIILESLSLKKRVFPRLASAFNYRHSKLALFRLLCDLSFQNVCTSLSIDPEILFPGLAFYPRITYGRCVLSPAKWRFSQTEFPDHFKQMRRFRDRHHVPQFVANGLGDQQLVFDLSDPAEVAFLLEHIQRDKEIVLTEYLLPDKSILQDHRPMAGQYLGLLYSTSSRSKTLPYTEQKKRTTIKRTFLPGDEWLYVKLYVAEASANRALQDLIAPFLKRHSKAIKSWFFIRYTDPEPHIRLRLLTAEAGVLLKALSRRVKNAGIGLIRDLKTGTYEREMERYGEERITLVETIFHAGSVLTIDGLASGIAEMPLAVITVVYMLQNLFSSPDERMSLARRSVESFRAEFNIGKSESIQLDKNFRAIRPELEAMIAARILPSNFKKMQKPLSLMAANMGDLPLDRRLQLAADLCHMQVNRSFASQQRRQELAVWTFVKKYFESLDARGQTARL